MRRTKATLAIFLSVATTFAVQYCMAEAADRTLEHYTSAVRGELKRLARSSSTFPPQGRAALRNVQQTKRQARTLIMGADSPAKKAVLSRELVDCLAESKRFRFFEYYIIWLASDLLKDSDKKELLYTLRDKIDSRDDLTGKADAEVISEVCGMSIEVILALCDYSASEPIVSDGAVNWKRWDDLSSWLERHRAVLEYRRKDRRWSAPRGGQRLDQR